MTSPETHPIVGPRGFWRVFVATPGGVTRDVTRFRNAPTRVTSMTTNDPFGDATASLHFPAITIMDRPGSGDLNWLVPFANVDIVHYSHDTMEPTGYAWEGFLVSLEGTEIGLEVSCVGALYQLDHFLAKPTYPQQPIPYETLISQAFDIESKPALRTAPLKIEWPEDWPTVVPDHSDETPWYLRPWGVTPGTRWTGLVSRSTGSWEPSLTGYVQTLLSLMHTPEGGQWTIRKDRGRVPVLHVREPLHVPRDDTLEVWVGAHGVGVSVGRDFSQTANVVYASGTDLSGASFSGMQVTTDGATTYYEPFAALPYVYPSSSNNPNRISGMMRKEIQFQLAQGVDAKAGRNVAMAHLRKVMDPGYTGSITLTTDPIANGQPFPRTLIRAGRTILVHGLHGRSVLFHISSVSVDLESQSVTLTVDSKFRDALTVDEVRERTRDALDPVRLLQVGRYSNTVQDLIKPWSYVDGSGIIPSGGTQDATELFHDKIPSNAQFPWEEWTRKYPPKKYPGYYIKIDAASANATDNWSGVKREGIARAGIPIKMAQAGTIRLSQIAAYDKDGNRMKVKFHVGIYGNSGVSPSSMPMVPAGGWNGYEAGQRNPFFPGAFERMTEDGTEQDSLNYLPADQIDMAIAWGNHYEGAGFSPGMESRGGERTGMLVDETSWSFDTSSQPGFDKYSVENTAKNPTAGMMYVLVYCDEQGDEPVYFLGRLWRQEPTG